MSAYTGTVTLQAATAPGPQVWTVGGGAADAADAVSLVGTVGGFIEDAVNNDVQLFVMTDAVNSIPDNATITNVQFNCPCDGVTGGHLRFRWGLQIDTTHDVVGNNAATWTKDYADLTDFGNPGLAWTRALINANNFDLICQAFGNIRVDKFFIIVTFTVPEIASPVKAVIAGGDTIDFTLSSGTIFDANYEITWTSGVVSGPFALTVITPSHGQAVSPAFVGFPFPSSFTINIGDPQDDIVVGTRPYNNPRFIGTLEVIENDYLVFLEDPSGTPTEYAVTGGVTMGSTYMGYLSKDISGVYTLVANQRFDRVYVRAGSTLTQDVQIPNPFAELGFTECDDE